METVTVGELTAEELERLVERAIDKRLEVWLTQLVDALTDQEEQENAALRPEFVASLRRSLEQMRAGEGMDLASFRRQAGR